MNDETVMRGRRWKTFYDEQGGISEAIDSIRKTYLERMMVIEPWETDKLSKLAMASKIAGELDNYFRAIIANGEIAHSAIESAKKIEKLPYAKRRFL